MSQTTLYDVFSDKGLFIMRAPLQTIRNVLSLAPAAIARIQRECDGPGGVCQYHLNKRPVSITNGDFVVIQLAVRNRNN